MKMAISYFYKENELKIEGNPCPICGKKTWNVFKCDKCGKVFCEYCGAKYIERDDDIDFLDITCECGSVTGFCD